MFGNEFLDRFITAAFTIYRRLMETRQLYRRETRMMRIPCVFFMDPAVSYVGYLPSFDGPGRILFFLGVTGLAIGISMTSLIGGSQPSKPVL